MKAVRTGFAGRCSLEERDRAVTRRLEVRRRALAMCVAVLASAACHRQPAAKAGPSAAAPDAVLTPYLAIHEGLAKDSIDGLAANASAIAAAARALRGPASRLGADAQALQSATTLADAREKFGALSEALATDARASGWKLPPGIREAYCPMAGKPWLQRGSMIANPYYGQEMPTCGEFK